MSMRPTLAVCYEGKIIDICMLKNWGIGSLLMAAFRTYDSYRDCRTAQEYKTRLLSEMRKDDPAYELPEDEEDFVRFFLSCSEFSLIVDMSLHCIYYGYHELTKDELLECPDSRTMMASLTRKQQYELDVCYLIGFVRNSVIWLDKMDVAEILRLADEAQNLRMFGW